MRCARDRKRQSICQFTRNDWKIGLRKQIEMRQKGNLMGRLSGSWICCCLMRLPIQREEAPHLSTQVYLILWKPLSKQAVILCIVKQWPGFSIRIKNSPEIWFPCLFAIAGCSPQPRVCLNRSCWQLLPSLPHSWWHTANYSSITLAVIFRDLPLAWKYPSMS